MRAVTGRVRDRPQKIPVMMIMTSESGRLPSFQQDYSSTNDQENSFVANIVLGHIGVE